MRLTVLQFRHGKTTTNRSGLGGTSPPSDPANAKSGGVSPSHVHFAASGPVGLAGANGPRPGRGTGDGSSASDPIPAPAPAERATPQSLGWLPPCPAESSRRGELPQTLGRTSQNWRGVGRLAPARSVGPTAGPPGGRLGRVSFFGPARLAQGGPRHTPPQSRSASPRGLEKNFRKCWRTS